MKRSFSTFIAFLLFTLMFFKVSSFHAYTHLDSDSNEVENCSICDLAIENHDTDFLLVASVDTPTPYLNTINDKQPTIYNVVVSSSFLHFNLFGRPPPNVV